MEGKRRRLWALLFLLLFSACSKTAPPAAGSLPEEASVPAAAAEEMAAEQTGSFEYAIRPMPSGVRFSREEEADVFLTSEGDALLVVRRAGAAAENVRAGMAQTGRGKRRSEIETEAGTLTVYCLSSAQAGAEVQTALVACGGETLLLELPGRERHPAATDGLLRGFRLTGAAALMHLMEEAGSAERSTAGSTWKLAALGRGLLEWTDENDGALFSEDAALRARLRYFSPEERQTAAQMLDGLRTILRILTDEQIAGLAAEAGCPLRCLPLDRKSIFAALEQLRGLLIG